MVQLALFLTELLSFMHMNKINVKIKRFLSSGNTLRFPPNDMHMWLTPNAMLELGILEASQRAPQYICIECLSPLNRFTIYGTVASINPRVEVEEGYIWIPSELFHKSIIFDKNTEVTITPVVISECAKAESVTVRLNENEVVNWSEEEAEKARRNFRIQNGLTFVNQCAFMKPRTKNVVVGVVDSIFPRPESHTQPFVIGKDTKIFLEGLPKNQQKVIDFKQIGGLSNVIEKLREIIQLPITYPDQLARFGIKPPKGMIMYGPPGNGKTMIARAVAQTMGSAFISIEGPELMSKYVGVGEQRLREKFEEAQTKGNCVIFIDEIDSIASVRSETAAEYQVSIVATLLNLMDGMKNNNVFVIGATNRINAIDPALRRPGRFDLEFEVPLPATAARLDILQKYIKLDRKHLFDENVTVQTLKRIADLTNGYSGADLSLLYREAAMLAVRRNVKIDSLSGKLEETSSMEESRISAEDLYESMKHIVPTAMRNEDASAYQVPWDDLIGVDECKNELTQLQHKMKEFANAESIQTRPSFANFVLAVPVGSGKHTLIYAFASKFGYEIIDLDFMRLLSKDQAEAFAEIERKFSKAKQIAPSIVLVSHLPESSVYQQYIEKITLEANSINKRSMVFMVLIHDGSVEAANKYLGYKRFGKVVSLELPNEDIVEQLLKKYTVPTDQYSLFEGKPIGQLITMLNEYSIDNKA